MAKPSVRPSIRARADLGELGAEDADLGVPLVRCGLGQADAGDLRIDERGPGERGVVDLLGNAEHRVLHRDGRLALGGGGGRGPLEDVADGEDAGRVGLQILVDLDAVLGVAVNPHGLQVRGPRRSPGGRRRPGGGCPTPRSIAPLALSRTVQTLRPSLTTTRVTSTLVRKPIPSAASRVLTRPETSSSSRGKIVAVPASTVTFDPSRASACANSMAVASAPRMTSSGGKASRPQNVFSSSAPRLGQSGNGGDRGTRTGRDHEPLGMEPGLTVDHDRIIGLERGRAVNDRRLPRHASDSSVSRLANSATTARTRAITAAKSIAGVPARMP